MIVHVLGRRCQEPARKSFCGLLDEDHYSGQTEFSGLGHATFGEAMYKDVLRLYNNGPLIVIMLTLRNHRK